MKMIKRNLPIAAALSLLALAALPVSAEQDYYRWTDESGTEVNSDRPPPAGTDYDLISSSTSRMRTGGTENIATAPAVQTETETEQKAPAPGNPTEPQFVKNPEYCAAARKNLDALNTHSRIRVPDGNGSFRYLNKEEKAEHLATAESVAKQHCE